MEENKVIQDQKVETVETKNEQEVKKSFSQEEVNSIVKSRVERERDAFAKNLGLETYSKEGVESILGKSKQLETQYEETTKKLTEYEKNLQEQTKTITALKFDIKEENLKHAFKLAEVELEAQPESSFEEALKRVIEKFPEVRKNDVKKFGIETGNKVEPPANPFVTDKLKKKYPFLKK